MLTLNAEDMKEAKRTIQEKGIKFADVKKLPPIGDIPQTHDIGPAIDLKSLY